MKAIISVTRGMDSARQAGRKYKVSARSIGRYIHVLKEMRANNPNASPGSYTSPTNLTYLNLNSSSEEPSLSPSLNSQFGGASEPAVHLAPSHSITLPSHDAVRKVKAVTDAAAQEIHSPSDVYAAEKLLVLLAASGTESAPVPASTAVAAVTQREPPSSTKVFGQQESSSIGDNSCSM